MSSISEFDSLERPTTTRRSWYRSLVLGALTRMHHGRLRITLPSGELTSLGDGTNPARARFGLHAAIDIHREDFFRRCFYYGDIGLAEGYMAGDWSTESVDEVISWFILNAESSPSQSASRGRQRFLNALGWINGVAHRLRSNSVGRSRENIRAHYDLSNEFFSLFLDPTMTYSSALFLAPDEALRSAQERKYERLCAQLALKAGDRVLEIGGGWGAFSRLAARKYGCHVTTVTISEKQFAWAAAKRAEEGLEQQIDLRLEDYRNLSGQYDKIVSIEMLEAVGHEYFDTFFAKCEELLAPNGVMAVQVITCPESRYEAMRKGVDFIQKHIFPGGHIPSVGALLASIHRVTGLTLHNLLDFGDSYAKTLERWSAAFESRLEEVRALGFDEPFIRKWRYYLMYCKAGFQMRHISVVQMTLTRPDNHDMAIPFDAQPAEHGL